MRGWESYIRRVTPYTPGEQPAAERLIKLNTNENPYPPAPAVRQALMEMIRTDCASIRIQLPMYWFRLWPNGME